jgi:hypothetical protein
MSVEFVIDAYMEAIKREGSIVGPVFYRLFSKYTNGLVAKKVGEKPPETEGLEETRSYLIDVCSKKCSTPREAMIYASNAMAGGVCMAEAYIEGATGPISRRIIRASVEDTLSFTGLMEEAGKLDSYAAGAKFVDVITRTVQYFDPANVSLLKEGNGDLLFTVDHCPGSEICNLLRTEGIKRVIGEECQVLSMLGLSVEFLVKRTTDYAVVSKQLDAADCKMKGRVKAA